VLTENRNYFVVFNDHGSVRLNNILIISNKMQRYTVYFNDHGSVRLNNILIISNKMQRYTVYFNDHGSVRLNNILIISNKMQRYTVYFIWKLLYMFRVIPSPIIRSANNCIWFECAVGGVRNPQHTQTSSNYSTIAADSSNGVTNTRCCRCRCLCSWWWLKVPPETCRAVSRWNKLCNVASCWIYILEYFVVF